MSRRSPASLIEYRTHYRWAVVAITALFLVLFYRFFLLQIVRGDEYRAEQVDEKKKRSRHERVPARRGRILDRNGVVLAQNVEGHDLVMYPSRVRHPEVTEELLRKLLTLDDEGDAQLRELMAIALENKDRYGHVVIRADLVSEHCPFDSARLKPRKRKRKTLWCSQCGGNYHPIEVGATRCPRDPTHKLKWNGHKTGAECRHDRTEYVAGTACPHDGAVLRERTWALECPVCERSFNNEVAIVKRDLYRMPGMDVKTSQRRVFPHRKVVAHITGYMNRVNARDLERYPERGYDPKDRIGRSGVERAFETQLRGIWGRRNYIREVSKQGPIIERPDEDSPDIQVVDGKTIRLTIDIELQKLVARAMRYHRAGGAAVVDVERGEILALYSKPSYDPNLWSSRLPPEVYRATEANPYTPMLNKALTPYAPGSVYKMVAAIAGLDKGLIDFSHEEHCHGYYEYHGRRFRCHNRTGHKSMNLVHAMSRSCDIYFYRLGERLSMDVLAEYATRYFGFGRRTGIEIAERRGIVPTKEWHRRTDRAWMPGFTLSTAVGQKDVRATPLQVARSYAAMANGGRLVETHIVQQVEDTGGNVVRVTRPKVTVRLPVTEEDLAGLKESFWRAVNDEHGTAFSARMDGIEVSGKTGTAEAAERKAGVSEEIAIWLKDDHAWFAGYAPSRKPEIAVAVFLEHGGSGGKAAGPVAMKIFKAYFSRRAQFRAHREEPASEDDGPNPIVQPGEPTGAKGKAKGKGKGKGKGKKPKINTTPMDM